MQISSNRLKEVQGQLYSGLKSGIELHWMADKKFHQSNLFNLGVALWKVHLEKRFPGVERKFFLFHLLFEMCVVYVMFVIYVMYVMQCLMYV